MVIFFEQGGQDSSAGAGATTGRRGGRASVTLAGWPATLQEIPAPGDRASSSEAGSPQPEIARDPEENWSGEDCDMDTNHPDPVE